MYEICRIQVDMLLTKLAQYAFTRSKNEVSPASAERLFSLSLLPFPKASSVVKRGILSKAQPFSIFFLKSIRG